jgi:hypothetical protein
VVYVESDDTQENLLKSLGRHLRDTANITIVFNLTGSCTVVSHVYAGARLAPNGIARYIPSTVEDPSWTPANTEATCALDADGARIDVGISAFFVDSCGLGDPPTGSGLGLIQGPVQAYLFVVPTASDQTAIWAEEAYYTFGFGILNPLAPKYDPWNNEAFMFIRPTTTSPLVTAASNIDLPPAKWKGVAETGLADVVAAVALSSAPEATIGILGAEVYDADRAKGIASLAFQAFGQNAAYYPDSTSSSFDKQNVRDGHYTLWSSTVYITSVDATNAPTNPAVKIWVDSLLGNVAATTPDGGAGFDGLADVVGVGLIPLCAMNVTRSADGADLTPSLPAAPCPCHYLTHVPGATGTPAGCQACGTDSDCGEGGATCMHGFCEPDRSYVPTPADGGGACFGGTPTTNSQVINACTSAQSIRKTVVLPNDGGLDPLP